MFSNITCNLAFSSTLIKEMKTSDLVCMLDHYTALLDERGQWLGDLYNKQSLLNIILAVSVSYKHFAYK